MLSGIIAECRSGESHTLLGLVDELDAVLEELAGHVEDLLHLVGHCELLYWVFGGKEVELALNRRERSRRGREIGRGSCGVD